MRHDIRLSTIKFKLNYSIYFDIQVHDIQVWNIQVHDIQVWSIQVHHYAIIIIHNLTRSVKVNRFYRKDFITIQKSTHEHNLTG